MLMLWRVSTLQCINTWPYTPSTMVTSLLMQNGSKICSLKIPEFASKGAHRRQQVGTSFRFISACLSSWNVRMEHSL